MESDQKQARVRSLAVMLSLVLMVSLLMSALPQTNAFAVTCKFKHTVAAGETVMYSENSFGGDWVAKLKEDNRSRLADVCIIVTQSLPDEVEKIGQIDGVWICSFQDIEHRGQLLILDVNQIESFLGDRPGFRSNQDD